MRTKKQVCALRWNLEKPTYLYQNTRGWKGGNHLRGRRRTEATNFSYAFDTAPSTIVSIMAPMWFVM